VKRSFNLGRLTSPDSSATAGAGPRTLRAEQISLAAAFGRNPLGNRLSSVETGIR